MLVAIGVGLGGGLLLAAPLSHLLAGRVLGPDRRITNPFSAWTGLGDREVVILGTDVGGGNTDVMLCERGIRTFESYTRNTFDISAIPVVQKLSHLPIIADPSHATGRRDKVAPMARAAVAAGADGLIIEVHCDPDHAMSDGAQSMFPSQFDKLMAELRVIAPAIGRSICVESAARRGWGR